MSLCRVTSCADELERLVAAGEIDTVIVAFGDMQGRLMGKRVSAPFFLDEAVDSGAECCNYLFAVDVDMNTVEGYAMSGWDTGYGDMVMKPDLTTLRRIPWLPGTALVLADVVWHDGGAIEPAPRRVLRRQLDRLRERGLRAYVGHRAGVHRLRRHVSPGLGERLSRADPGQRLQHGLRGDGLQSHRATAARHPTAHAGCGAALGGRQGGVQPGTAGARVHATTRR